MNSSLAAQIIDAMLENGSGEVGTNLGIRRLDNDGVFHDLGGYDRSPAILAVQRVLDEAVLRLEEEKPA